MRLPRRRPHEASENGKARPRYGTASSPPGVDGLRLMGVEGRSRAAVQELLPSAMLDAEGLDVRTAPGRAETQARLSRADRVRARRFRRAADHRARHARDAL